MISLSPNMGTLGIRDGIPSSRTSECCSENRKERYTDQEPLSCNTAEALYNLRDV